MAVHPNTPHSQNSIHPLVDLFTQSGMTMEEVLSFLGAAQALQEPLLNTRQAATYLNLSPRTLEQYRWLGTGPAHLALGRAIRYRKEDLLTWSNACTRSSTSAKVVPLKTASRLPKVG